MYNALRQLNVFNELERELGKASAPLSVSGCMDSQKIQLISELAKKQLLYIVPDEKNVSLAIEDLKNFKKAYGSIRQEICSSTARIYTEAS